MTEEKNTEKLSDLSYWDEVLKSAKLPRINSKKNYLYSVTMKYVDPALKDTGIKTFFEVGCGSSGWLPYFSKQYQFIVSGLDYSEIGCELARKNLTLQDVIYGEILCKDFFTPDPTEGKHYDAVFSYGVIEHFSDPVRVVGIFNSFLNDGGIMITLVPNLAGVIGKLTKYFVPEVYKIHNVINTELLKSYHLQNGMKIIKNGYAGIFAFNVMPWIKSKHWLFKEGTRRRIFFLFLLRGADRVMGKLFKLLPFDFPTRFFSPYVICIAKKN